MAERVPQSSGRQLRAGESSQQESSDKSSDDQTLIRRVAERVWQLWQEDLRRSRERVGKQPGS